MSEVAEAARVGVLLCDFANVDTSGKINILGGGWQVTGLQPTGQTPAQTIVMLVEVPPKHYGEQFALSLTLLDGSNEPVKVPGPTGELEVLRISQLVKAERPSVPSVYLPPDALPGRAQVVLNFANGLPLAAGQTYTWQASIDDTPHPQWCAKFHVAGAPPPPVVG